VHTLCVESAGTTPQILNIRVILRWVICFMPKLLYPWEKISKTYWLESWVGPTAGLNTSEKRKISCSCQKMNHDFLVVQPVCSLVTMLPMLSQLPLYIRYSLINSYKCGNTQDINNVIFVWLQVCIRTTRFMSSTHNSFFIQYLTFK